MSEYVSCPVFCQCLAVIIVKQTYPLPPGVEVVVTAAVVVVMAILMLALEAKILPFLTERSSSCGYCRGRRSYACRHLPELAIFETSTKSKKQIVTNIALVKLPVFPLSTQLPATVFVESYTPASPTTQQNPFP
jgi:hypothetical protein